MRCWNCGKKIPDNALICGHCEAAVDDGPGEEEEAIGRDILAHLPPEAIAELQAALEKSNTAKDFVNSIFVGECPACGSGETGDCEEDHEIGELFVGRCYQCGQLWCTECGRLLTRESHECPCWDEDE